MIDAIKSEYDEPSIYTEEAKAEAVAKYQSRLTELKQKPPVAFLDGGEVFVEFDDTRGHDIFIWNALSLEAVGYVGGDATTDDHIKALIEEHGIDSVEAYQA
ncbi:hypothetical protein [Pseudomonas sp. 4810-S13]|uniref:hypothetical protein n=1 Tax=Pseudomonas sp. 4810-S13 TaxID=3120822 RepID=UPI00103A3E94